MFRTNSGIVGCMGLCGGGVGTTLMENHHFEDITFRVLALRQGKCKNNKRWTVNFPLILPKWFQGFYSLYIWWGRGWGGVGLLSIMDKKEDCWILKILRHTVFLWWHNLNLPEFTLFSTNLKLISWMRVWYRTVNGQRGATHVGC